MNTNTAAEENPVKKTLKKTLGIIIVIISACLIYGFFGGIRANISFISGVLAQNIPNLSYSEVSIAFTIFTIVTGICGPFFGYLAMKKSNLLVLIIGFAMTILGLTGMILSTTLPLLIISVGFIFAAGAGGLSYGIIFGAVSPLLGEKEAAFASGIISASGSIFGVILSPLMAVFTDLWGFNTCIGIFIAAAFILLPLPFLLFGRKKEKTANAERKSIHLREFAGELIKSKIFYILLLIYFAYGILAGSISNHMYTIGLTIGLSGLDAAISVSWTNIASTLGMLAGGFIIAYIHKKCRMVGILYLIIAILWACMLLIPGTNDIAFLLTITPIFLYSAILPIATIIIKDNYSAIKIATIICTLNLVLKLGKSLSSLVGGFCADFAGNFDLVLLLGSAIAFAASVIILIHARKEGKTPALHTKETETP